VNKLLKYFARGGEKVVQASSDYSKLGVYAVRGEDRSVRILVINKHPSETLNARISVPALKRARRPGCTATASRRTRPRTPATVRGRAAVDADLERWFDADVHARAILRARDRAQPA
jgi:hypothetical protein